MKTFIKKLMNNLSSIPIQAKIFSMIIAVIVIISGFNLVVVRDGITETWSEELDERVKSIGSDVAARSRDLFLTHNVYLLHELLQNTLENNRDIEYVFILDEQNNVFVHTFGEQRISEELLAINKIGPNEDFQIKKFETDTGVIRDVAVPIIKDIGGTVRVGLSEKSLHEALSQVTTHIFVNMLIVMFIAGAIVFSLTKLITAPITKLLMMTKEVSKGNLSMRIKGFPRDEIGKLNLAFNNMLASLEKAEIDKESYYQEVMLRNRELSLLNKLKGNVISVEIMENMLEKFVENLVKELDFNSGILTLKMLDQWKIFSYAKEGCVCETECSSFIKGEECKIHHQSKIRYKFPIHKEEDIGKLEICSHQQLDEKSIDILSTLANQIAVSIENMELWDELKQNQELRKKLLEKIISAQEEERKRIARELHDETSQSLTSVVLGLTVLQDLKEENKRLEKINNLKNLIQGTLQEVHDMAWQLRPSILDKFGLVVALERYIAEFREKHGIDTDLMIVGMEGIRLLTEVETSIYRIVQESLTNIVKYAKAKNVSVIVKREQNLLAIIIEDDGVGFHVEEIMKRDPSKYNLGLIGMKERALFTGGKLFIESEINKGTTIYVKIPI